MQIRQPTAQENYDYYRKQAADMSWGTTFKTKVDSDAYSNKRRGFSNQANKYKGVLDKEKADAWAVDAKNPEVQSQAAWDEAMKLFKREGPYTPQVTQQLVNRQADQTAFAEGVNAEELRNSAAARGLSPNDPGIQAALRQGQAQRQQSNIAFQGDIASQAAIQNFNAQTPGMMAAAQANLGRQFGADRTPAVQGGGGMPSMQRMPVSQPQRQPIAFAGNQSAPAVKPVIAPTVQKPAMSMADRNAAQTAWANSGGKTINGTPGKTAFGVTPTAAANKPAPTFPMQGGYANGKQYGAIQTFGL
jgi:hypothetical protein